MLDIFLDKIKRIFSSRLVYLSIAVVILFSILIGRMYKLQILETRSGEIPVSANTYKTSQTRYVEATRGNIYDRNGNLLAFSELSYNVVMTNSALVTKNSAKNEMIYKLINILESNGYSLELDFPIIIDEEGQLAFLVSGNAELRFKKNAYGLTSVNKLSEEQKAATAEEVYEFLKKGDSRSSMFGISDDYSLEDSLKIMTVRYELFTLYPQYSQFTLCSNINDRTIAALKENSSELIGVEVKRVTTRVYNDSIYFAHILGYTGTMNENEADSLNSGLDEAVYNTYDVIGKTGIEKELDAQLRGTKGIQNLTVSNSGKIVSSELVSEPVAGNDIYLTIDRELQICCYHILENNIAAILKSKIVNSMSYGGKGTQANKITIPIYEVYNAFFANEIIDMKHMALDEATELEQKTYNLFVNKKQAVLEKLALVLDYNNPTVNNKLSEEMADYIEYIYYALREDGVLDKSLINTKDSVYNKYLAGDLSLCEFLSYAIDNQWVDLSKIGIGSDYNTNQETYSKITEYIFKRLSNDASFDKKLYKVLIFTYKLTGRDVCMLLFDQKVLDYNENDYKKLNNGRISAYDFIMEKLEVLDITPGMLGLEPCSGSIVITDVNTGDVLAEVSYPSYDNNMLANKIDWKYYSSLLSNNSTPLFNRPTQQLTTTGSTFKPLMSLAGLGEGIISTKTTIKDAGIFEEVDPSPKCWKYPGSHGSINLTQAIQHSCNYFFYDVGYKMSLDSSGNYSDSLGISKIQKYAAMFGLAAKSGVEVPEAMPAISSTDAVRTSIGYYHSFTPIQIARYVTAIANKGTVYNLTLVDKIVNKKENTVENNAASVYNQIDIYTDDEWSAVQRGMYNVVNTSANDLDDLYGDLGVLVAGKTGTAQVSLTHPSHALFVSFAPYKSPEISVAVVIPNGYASANSAKLAREVYGLYFNDENKEALLSGDLTTTTVTNIVVSD